MRSLQAFRYLLSGIVIATGTVSIVGAVEIPKPTVTVNVPKVQIQRPTINVPKPTVNLPKPTVNVAKPVVAKPVVSTAPSLASSKSEIVKSTNSPAKLPDKGPAPAVGAHDDRKTVSLPKNGSASTISSSSSGADKLKSGGLPTAVPGASKSTGLNPGQNNPAKKPDKPLIRAMSPARLMATDAGDDDDDDSGSVTLNGASRLPGAKGANSKIQPEVRPMSLARLATGDDDDDDDSSGSLTPTSKPSTAKAKVAAPQPKPVIKAKAAKPAAKAAWGIADPSSDGSSGDDDDDSSGSTPAPQQQASTGDSSGDDSGDDSGGDSSGQGTGSSGSNGNLPGNVTVSSDGKSATATGPNGAYANATANSDGSVTVKTNNGNVTLSPQQEAAIAKGDFSSLQGLMGNAPSMGIGSSTSSPLNLPNQLPIARPDINVTGTASQNFNSPGLGQTTDNASLKGTGDGFAANAGYSQTQNQNGDTTKSVVSAGAQVGDTNSAGLQFKQTDSNPSASQSSRQTQVSGTISDSSGSVTVTDTQGTQQNNGKQGTSSGFGVKVSDSPGGNSGSGANKGDSLSVDVTTGQQGKTQTSTVSGDVAIAGVGDVKVTDQSSDTPGSSKQVGQGKHQRTVTTPDKTTETTTVEFNANVTQDTSITYSQANGTNPSQGIDVKTKAGSTNIDLGATKNSAGAVTGNASLKFPVFGGQVGVDVKNIGGGPGPNGPQVGVNVGFGF